MLNYIEIDKKYADIAGDLSPMDYLDNYDYNKATNDDQCLRVIESVLNLTKKEVNKIWDEIATELDKTK